MVRISFRIISILVIILTFVVPPSISAGVNEPVDNFSPELDIHSDPEAPASAQAPTQASVSTCTGRVTDEQRQLYGQEPLSSSEALVNSLPVRARNRDRIRVTANSDGTRTAEFYIKPTFYMTASADQEFIDTTIERTMRAINPDYQYKCTKNNLRTYFRAQFSPNNPGEDPDLIYLTRESDQHGVTWQPVGMLIQAGNNEFEPRENNNRLFPGTITHFNQVIGHACENKIAYKNIIIGVDDQYSVLPNKLKHEVVLDRDPLEIFDLPPGRMGDGSCSLADVNGFTLDYYGILALPPDLEPRIDNIVQHASFESSGPVELCTPTGEVVYNIPRPVTFESSDPVQRVMSTFRFIPLGHAGNVHPLVVPSQSCSVWTKTMVVLKTDLTWLTAPEREYPVVIDPDFEIPEPWDTDKKGYDTYLVKGNETQPYWSDYNFGQSNELKVSLAGPSLYSMENLYYRSILKFPEVGNELSERAQILDAKLILQSKSSPGKLAISVFRLSDDWI